VTANYRKSCKLALSCVRAACCRSGNFFVSASQKTFWQTKNAHALAPRRALIRLESKDNSVTVCVQVTLQAGDSVLWVTTKQRDNGFGLSMYTRPPQKRRVTPRTCSLPHPHKAAFGWRWCMLRLDCKAGSARANCSNGRALYLASRICLWCTAREITRPRLRQLLHRKAARRSSLGGRSLSTMRRPPLGLCSSRYSCRSSSSSTVV